MKEIHVKSLPLKQFIDDLASFFGVAAHRDCEVYRLELPNSIGCGTIRGINFSSGLGLVFYDCTFKKSIKIHFDKGYVHPAKLLYCLEGEIVHYLGDSGDIHRLRPYEYAFVGSSDKKGRSLSFSGGQRVTLSSVEIDRDLFVEAYGCELKTLKSRMSHLFTDIHVHCEFYHKGHLSLRHREILSSIHEEDWIGLSQRLSLQSKATELMLWAFENYDDDQCAETKKSPVEKSDVEIIRRAADLISCHISTPLNVAHLAEKVGTNTNKLQNGFKSLFGATVNGYVQRLRLEKTCYYLESTDLNISEIVTKIGLSNHGYHSRMFKNEYGLTPKDYRKKIRGN